MQTLSSRPCVRSFRSICLALGATTLGMLTSGPAALAAGGYGPVSPGPSGAPGGFTKVVATKSFGASGGALKTKVGADRFDVSLPAHAFGSGRVEVEVTKPNLAALDHALPRLGLRRARVITGLGVAFLGSSGAKLPPHRFRRPVRIILEGAGLSQSLRVLDLLRPGKARPLRLVRLSSIGKLARIAITVRGSEDIFVVGTSHKHR